jgi:hypothetical protein
MNKKALLVGVAYCVTTIIFKLIVLFGGYSFTKFGFYYAQIISVLMLIPFFILAIYLVREKDFGGVISGRDAVRMALTVLAVGIVVISIYNYIEFSMATEQWISYYKSEAFMDVLKNMHEKMPAKVKTEDFQKIINEQISSLSAGKATTGKLFPMILIGLGSAFACGFIMKRSAK